MNPFALLLDPETAEGNRQVVLVDAEGESEWRAEEHPAAAVEVVQEAVGAGGILDTDL